MDSALSKETIRKRRIVRLIKWTAGITLLIASILVISVFSSTRIKEDELYISTVKRGMLEETLGAVGKVVPMSQEIIISPVTSKILEICKNQGDSIRLGETIMKLDLSQINSDLQQAEDEMTMQELKMAQAKALKHQQISELEMQIEIDQMKLARAESALYNERHLDSLGASTNDRVHQAELEHFVQKKQLEHLRHKLENLKESSKLENDIAELEYEISRNRYSILKRTAEDARIAAPYDAVITWIDSRVGANVSQGANLVILSDLERFKIEAEAADVYADKINSGNLVHIRLGQDTVSGRVGNIVPSVANSMLKFDVLLDNTKEYPGMRMGQNPDINVVSSIKNDVLYIDYRSFYKGPGMYDLWVIEGDTATQRKVGLGVAGHQQIEVTSGLNAGDRVILSNMNRFGNKKRIFIY